MVQTKKGWDEQLMMSLRTKEATYDAGVTMNDTNGMSMTGFETDVQWPDRVETDKTEVTGNEHGTKQELISQGFTCTYTEAHAKANAVAGLGALVMGAVSSAQDGASTSYTHTITPVAAGTALPSIQLEQKKGGVQHAYKGVKGQSISLSGEEGGPVVLAVELIGSGTRAVSATAFASKVTENWLLLTKCNVWMEDGSNISITGSPVQEAEDVSSATPVDLGPRIKGFNWKYMNNATPQMGMGSAVAQDVDYVHRSVELSLTVLFNDITEMDHYTNQDALAIEFDLAMGVIDSGGGGTIKEGIQLIIPRSQLKIVPKPEGGVDDELTMTLECDVQDDGTNPVSKLYSYNAQAAYLA